MDGKVVATVCGVVERVNKLIYVRTLRSRYQPAQGDIVVGRVIEVVPKRWRIEVNFSQDAVLMLSSMNLPDGVQRRRTAMDELNMRSIFEENDVICAEVRDTHKDGGSLQLQARSQKYGKLEKGQLLTVPPYLVKKSNKHFHYLDQYGMDLIMGRNGFIWIGEHVDVRDDMVEDQIDKPDVKSEDKMSIDEVEEAHTPLETRQNICRVAIAIRVLSSLSFTITVELVMQIVELSKSLNLEVHEMLGGEFHVLIAEKEVERRRTILRRR